MQNDLTTNLALKIGSLEIQNADLKAKVVRLQKQLTDAKKPTTKKK